MAKKEKAKAYSPPRVSVRKDFKKNKVIYMMFLPLAIYFIVFNYIPMAGILMAFQNFKVTKGLFGSEWVGLQNFVQLFTGSAFLNAFRNTAVMATLSLVLGFLPPIILALLFSECKSKKFKRISQIFSYMPNFVSTVVVCALATEFLGEKGGITRILSFFGLETQNWLANTNIPVFWLIYVFIGIWVSFGYGSIIYTTAISNVNNDLKEAAALDGANRFQRVIKITVPSILPLCMISLTMCVGTMFMVGFDRVLLLYMPKTYDVSDVLYTYTYRMAFGSSVNYGVSTASGLFQSVIGTVLLLVSNALNKKLTNYSLF